MTTKLPLDSNGHPIPALRLKSSGAHKITITATSARNATAFSEGTRVIGLYASEDVYVNVGGSSVTASTSSHFIPAGLYYDIALGGDGEGHASHIAAIRSTADGVLYVSEKE